MVGPLPMVDLRGRACGDCKGTGWGPVMRAGGTPPYYGKPWRGKCHGCDGRGILLLFSVSTPADLPPVSEGGDDA